MLIMIEKVYRSISSYGLFVSIPYYCLIDGRTFSYGTKTGQFVERAVLHCDDQFITVLCILSINMSVC